MPNILVDTGFWYALFDRRDSLHLAAEEKSARLRPLNIVIPWPVLYETLNTRFVSNRAVLRQFVGVLRRPGAVVLDDGPYRERALDVVSKPVPERPRMFSLTDCILRLILDDADTRIDFLATFNVGDFADICRKRRIQLL